MYPPSSIRKDSTAEVPLLPLAALTSSSRFASSRWAPPRRTVLFVLAIGAFVLLWNFSGRVRELQGGYGGAELARLTEGSAPELRESAFSTDTGTAREDVAEPTDDPTFSPRLPCNALTSTAQTLLSGRTQTWLSPSPPSPLTATLDERLSTWLSSPIANHTTWTRFNRQTCGNPSVRRNQNKLHFRKNYQAWPETSAEKVEALREELTAVLRKAQEEGKFEEWQKEGKKGTRGIVWTAGNADTFDRVLVSLRLLRHSYQTTLAATVFHFPSETPSAAQLEDFSSLGASVHPLSLSKDEDPHRTKSFHLKGAAIVEAPYDEVLMLDSDNVPARDVSGLWDSPEFKEMGVVLWPDYWKNQPENAIWSILGIQCRDELTTEAGQLLIRKSQHLDALILVAHMLQNWPFWFQFSDGDKDLFRYALLALRKRWAVPSRPLSPASWTDPAAVGEKNRDKFAGHTILQYGLASEEGGIPGRPLFVHANLLKRVVANVGKGSTWGRTLQLRLRRPSSPSGPPHPPGFVLQADHVLNPSPFTGLGSLRTAFSPLSHRHSSSSFKDEGENVPTWVREQNLVTRGVSMHYWDGHRGAAYVLSTEIQWVDELRSFGLMSGEGKEGEGEGDGEAKGEGERGVEEEEKEQEEKPWEVGEMEREEWDEWARWVEREKQANCAASGSGPGLGSDLRSALFPSTSSSPTQQEASNSSDFSPLTVLQASKGFLEVVSWKDDPDLSGFEERFYEVGKGKAGGNGFR
ncbi:hypothetical protein JCM11251_004188 [Rhodosporidiobolus azoricus]